MYQKLSIAIVLTLATSSQGLLTTASKENGIYTYNFATVPFLAEVIKLITSSALLYCQVIIDPKGVKITRDLRNTLMYPIPSLIYLVHNNIQFLTLKYVDPSTYQILGNLKIVTTGVLFRVILKRQLSRLQWIALSLLMIGATISQIGCNGGSSFAAPIEGYILGIISACLSALAGVYTEKLMKMNDDNLYWQNMQLYGFGVIFNALRLFYDDFGGNYKNGCSLWPTTLIHGYSFVTWLVVLNLAFTGLLVSWVMKFADTIVKVYSTSMAMLVTMVVSIFLFDIAPNLQLILGIITASLSLHLYYLNPTDLGSEVPRMSGKFRERV